MVAKIVYLDTSSLVKRYLKEQGSAVMDRAYAEAERGNLILAFSIWNIGEAQGVVDQRFTRGQITKEECDETIEGMLAESTKMSLMNTLRIIPITVNVLVPSWDYIVKHHMYISDALQISSAKEAQCDLFLSADSQLIGAAQREGVKTVDVESDPQEAVESLTAT